MALGGNQDVKKPPGPSGSSPSLWDSLRHWTDRHWSTQSRLVHQVRPTAGHGSPQEISRPGVSIAWMAIGRKKKRDCSGQGVHDSTHLGSSGAGRLHDLKGRLCYFLDILRFGNASQSGLLNTASSQAQWPSWIMFAHRVRVQTSTTNLWQKTVSFGPRINQVCWLHQR